MSTPDITLMPTPQAAYAAAAFVKNDTGKPRFSLLPPGPILELVKVLSFGAAKYGADNWRTAKPEDLARYKDALGRHLNAYAAGEALDAESGLPHLAHALCNIVFLMELEENQDSLPAPPDDNVPF